MISLIMRPVRGAVRRICAEGRKPGGEARQPRAGVVTADQRFQQQNTQEYGLDGTGRLRAHTVQCASYFCHDFFGLFLRGTKGYQSPSLPASQLKRFPQRFFRGKTHHHKFSAMLVFQKDSREMHTVIAPSLRKSWGTKFVQFVTNAHCPSSGNLCRITYCPDHGVPIGNHSDALPLQCRRPYVALRSGRLCRTEPAPSSW